MFNIYVLIQEDTEEIRYVGITSRDDIQLRYKEHIRNSKKTTTNNYKVNWIRQCLNKNIGIRIEKIDTANDEHEAGNKEIYYIDKYISEGYRLTNGTKGGEINKDFTDDVKRKISESLKKFHENNPNIWKGRKMPEEFVKKQSELFKTKFIGEGNPFFGKTHTDESKRLQSISHKKHNIDKDELYDMFITRKMPQKDIADHFGMNRSYICRILVKYGIKNKKNAMLLTKETKNKINTMLEDGIDYKIIYRELHIDRSVVMYYNKKFKNNKQNQ